MTAGRGPDPSVGPVLDGERGCVLVARDGEVVTHGESGPADVEAGTTCTPGTRFQIASVSKQLAAALVLLLVEDGVLGLHRPVGEVLDPCPPVWSDLTLHHLVSHTAGLEHWNALPGFDPADPGDTADVLARMARLPLRSEPGTRWSYSSPGFLLAAVVVEAATGRPYAELLTARVLEPLGLTETVAGRVPATDVARGYRDGRRVDVDAYATLPGTGDVWSTVGDLVRWSTALHGGGLLSDASHALLVGEHGSIPATARDDDPASAWGYGYGCFIGSVLGHRAWLHPGDNPGYRSFVAHLPDLGTTVAVLTNDEGVDVDDVLRRLAPVLDA